MKDTSQLKSSSDELVLPELNLTSSTPKRDDEASESKTKLSAMFSRKRYSGALLFNLAAFILPALYSTLSKLWIANIDGSLLVTTDAYTYLSTVVEVINEGLPRAAWSTIGNRFMATDLDSRLKLAFTLIIVQSGLGFVLSLIFLGAAVTAFVGSFVPGPVKKVSVQYIRISSFGSFASTLDTAVSLNTRALDHPDVPLGISCFKTLAQIFLDLALISPYRIKSVKTPTIGTQAGIRLFCDMAAAFVGLMYFLYIARKHLKRNHQRLDLNYLRVHLPSLKVLYLPGRWTALESAIRNAIYLVTIHSVVQMGNLYATSWGVFTTIRWGLVMVPVQALEATSNTFVGHRFGFLQVDRQGREGERVSWKETFAIIKPALISTLLALVFELPLLLGLSLGGAKRFGYYLSQSEEVSLLVEKMWRTIDWCYITYAISTCLATILLATKTRWYLYQSLASNLLYCLPWAIVVSVIDIDSSDAWFYHAFIFGGSLVFSFVTIFLVDGLWIQRLRAGKIV